MGKKIFEYIKKFKLLINIKFSHNNIYSFYQLIKLENLENLQKLSISDNEVCNAYILKYFIFYRLNNLKYFNNKAINEDEVDISRAIFQYFDELISIKEKIEGQNKDENEQKDDENKENKNTIENKENIISEKNYEDEINNSKLMIEFFNYATVPKNLLVSGLISLSDFAPAYAKFI